ncbi:MAG: tRNA uridine-5-carboxymethylaminomethyl(34) synthesis GTPase MnmE [Alphaproteobacteria bacterium]|nr:tRNA uridine-5-carboxymethylaminomethyl(34) synthesis GTPase MnmE [Alphaproteobacteria bacterium]
MSSVTIFAPSSGAGAAGLAVIRISGPASGEVLQLLSGKMLPVPRYATRVTLSDPRNDETMDDGLALWFPAPASFTGEDVAELHIHGGRATVEVVCSVLGSLNHCRIAEPGEFSRRAFDNEKLDLAEIEGLADLIAAETGAQRKQALRQLSGGISEVYEGWRDTLLRLLAHAEAAIDFPEEDLPDNLLFDTKHNILGISQSITHYIKDNRRGERLRDGFQITIAGPPNAGKSSLLNELARRDVAIVSEQAGTTRDVIEVRLDLGGFPVTIADTAGMRSTTELIEAEGVRRAKNRAETADLTIYVVDASIEEFDLEIRPFVKAGDVIAFNKADLVDEEAKFPQINDVETILTSVKTGFQLDTLIECVTGKVRAALSENAGPPPLTRLRHREALRDCCSALTRALDAAEAELMAEDLRLAARALGRITGRVDVEDILDVIFGEFCIGK